MAEMIELSELDFNDVGNNNWDNKKSTNFGGGLEFLMNDKVKNGSGNKSSNDIDIGDLNALEAELNELSDVAVPSSSASKSVFFSGIGAGGGSSNNNNSSSNIYEHYNNRSSFT